MPCSSRRSDPSSSSHECSVGLMEDQFVDRAVWPAAKLDAEFLELDDGEDAALVGAQFVGRLIRRCQRERTFGIERHHMGRRPMAENAGTGFAKARIHAIAGGNADEHDIFDPRLEWSGKAGDVAFTVRGK